MPEVDLEPREDLGLALGAGMLRRDDLAVPGDLLRERARAARPRRETMVPRRNSEHLAMIQVECERATVTALPRRGADLEFRFLFPAEALEIDPPVRRIRTLEETHVSAVCRALLTASSHKSFSSGNPRASRVSS